MTAQADLQRLVLRWADDVARGAKADLERQIAAARLPRDTGRLQTGVKVTGPTRSGATIELVATSTARNPASGFDYPAFLEDVAYIAPTRARMLSWVSGGRRVFSAGFVNRHQHWWSDYWRSGVWAKAVQAGGRSAR